MYKRTRRQNAWQSISFKLAFTVIVIVVANKNYPQLSRKTKKDKEAITQENIA